LSPPDRSRGVLNREVDAFNRLVNSSLVARFRL
jgi:hypothetical protein